MARPHIVIVGAGFGGLSAAHALANAEADVTVVDRRNYHLFQPLLYQVATAGLSPAQIASPIRAILRRAANIRVVLGRVSGVDRQRRTVEVDGHEIEYDQLVLATGSRHAYFGHDEWERVAPGLKKIDDATGIRRRILTAFEHAEAMAPAEDRRRFLTFVVIGAGPTGVEMAGAIAELAHVALRHDFRTIDPREARIVLVEAGPRVLPAFPLELSAAAQKALDRLHVEVRLGTPVSNCDETGVTIGEDHLPAATIVWAAGVAASPAARWLGTEADPVGRVVVGPDFTVPGHPEIFVIGDTAHALDASGKLLPGLAPVAKQQGAYVARVLRARIAGKRPPGPFRYRDWGTMATIGRRAAVADFGWLRLSGTLAWLMWGLVHVSFLIGFRNRLVVMLDWIWSYLTFQSGARLIVGPGSH
ncbi:MAG: NAD(P)/FAD-dependent oxidoreductase [Reyranella sp.]|jgi:NADH dehydrogenase|uniref:NAD(P)/FAD-dependent oxidoreductase n=1 Tax=Reyranella sp. TaxID=1929291 RepID=UPI0025E00DC2|nr:NAD(P)/FAD-dependent oxidoreductase [Reyranella sp.]MBR2817366.1 NAD(P)/FAD-dependent oxidoreductase [Reyranella sp.]